MTHPDLPRNLPWLHLPISQLYHPYGVQQTTTETTLNLVNSFGGNGLADIDELRWAGYAAVGVPKVGIRNIDRTQRSISWASSLIRYPVIRDAEAAAHNFQSFSALSCIRRQLACLGLVVICPRSDQLSTLRSHFETVLLSHRLDITAEMINIHPPFPVTSKGSDSKLLPH
jgi:hypothetical protein